jgi:putative hydrolase of the HAD superfamily
MAWWRWRIPWVESSVDATDYLKVSPDFMPLIHVFDLGGVLLPFDDERFFERVRPRCRAGVSLRDELAARYDRAGVELGKDFESFYNGLIADLELDMTLEEFTRAFNDIFEPNEPMLEVVRNAPRPRYLLSNTNEPHVTWIREQYPDVFPLFDGLVLSNEVGVRKPEPGIYHCVESLSGAPAEQHVFVDDVPEYVEGARAVGWNAIRFVDTDDCVRQLAEFSAGCRNAP